MKELREDRTSDPTAVLRTGLWKRQGAQVSRWGTPAVRWEQQVALRAPIYLVLLAVLGKREVAMLAVL